MASKNNPRKELTMDPNETLRLCSEALRDGDLDEAREHHENLREWLAKGGFPPEWDRDPEVWHNYWGLIWKLDFRPQSPEELEDRTRELLNERATALAEPLPEECDECSGTRWPDEHHEEHCSLYMLDKKGEPR